jgi:SEC-C motif-containing protein
MLSHHSSTRPEKRRKSIQKWAESVQWMGLVILGTQAGGASDDHGYVEFRALYLDAGKMCNIRSN